METTLTIRLTKTQRAALKRRASAEKRSESAHVRHLIERDAQSGLDYEKVRHLIGSLKSKPRHWEKDPLRRQIRERNWRS